MQQSEAQSRLAGKVAIITGASRGLGEYCAFAYAYSGAKVALIGRNPKETNLHLPGNVFLTAEHIQEQLGADALPLVGDITDPASAESMVAEVLKRFGRVDILLNNAGYSMPEGEKTTEISLRLFEQMLRVNVLGSFTMIRSVMPIMQDQRSGNIINVSGRSRKRGSPLEATKAAIETYTIGMAEELRPHNIAVNCLRPVGFVDTPGVLLNEDVKPDDVTPPNSYVDASIMLAMQSADKYTGQLKTDAEVLRDLGGEAYVKHYGDLNPPAWRESLAKA